MTNWIDLKNFEGLYQISEFGEVRSIRNGKNGHLAKGISSKGYFQVHLCKNGYCKNHLLHRLIAKHFIPNPDNKPQVNHIDGNRQNNDLSNLEWATAKENSQHAYDMGLKKPIFGIKPKNTKLSIEQVNEIRGATNTTQTALAQKYKVSRINIQRILKNEIWR